MGNLVNALWACRGFVAGSVKRELQSKVRQLAARRRPDGTQPAGHDRRLHGDLLAGDEGQAAPGVDSTFAYSIYLCAGLLRWNVFAEIVGRSQNIFLEHANLMKKQSSPA